MSSKVLKTKVAETPKKLRKDDNPSSQSRPGGGDVKAKIVEEMPEREQVYTNIWISTLGILSDISTPFELTHREVRRNSIFSFTFLVWVITLSIEKACIRPQNHN